MIHITRIILFFTLLSCATRKHNHSQKESKDFFHVLSYNICWECMTNNHDNTNLKGSASFLGAACFPTKPRSKLTLCAKNIAQLLEKTSIDPTVSLDFISFQEAARWKELVKNTPKSLQKMSYDVQKAGSEEIITFLIAISILLKDRLKAHLQEDGLFKF